MCMQVFDSPELAVTVIVPVHNGGQPFRACLASLAVLDPPAGELIVVNDGSTDGSDRVAGEFQAQVLHTATMSGPAHARNLGARAAGGDLLLFVDADVAVCPDAVAQVARAFARAPGLSAVFGSYDDAPAEAGFLSQYKNLLHHYVHQTAQEDAFSFWAGCGAIRREVFLGVGGFDERFRKPAIEDIELGYRLKAAGHSIRLIKSLQVKHLKRWSRRSLLRTDFLQRALPWTELILQYGRLANDLNIAWTSRACVVAVFGLIAALVAAWWWPASLALAGALAVALGLLNWPVYRFFFHRRGLLFTLRAIPWHWFYYLYSGVAFGIVTARHSLRMLGLTPRSEDRVGPKKMEREGAGTAS